MHAALRFPWLALAPALLAATPPAWGQTPAQPAPPPPAEVRAAFRKLLDRPRVPLDPSVPEITVEKSGLIRETLSIASDRRPDGSAERVPLLVLQGPRRPGARRAAVLVLHGTGGAKEQTRPWLVEFARRGMVGVALDARFHAARVGVANGSQAYQQAIVNAWRTPRGQPQPHPFYYDTVWDIWRTLDWLEQRQDIDPRRIGMVGISMGGIQTWLAASVDERVAAAAPLLAVQSFRWSLENDRWQARANTIAPAHEAAAFDLGLPRVEKPAVQALWDKIIPGIRREFDGPSMLRLFAGRHLFIGSGAQDPNCPLPGAELAIAAAQAAFRDAGTPEKLRIDVAKGVGHVVTKEMQRDVIDWLGRCLADPPPTK